MEVPKLQKALQILSDNPETVDTARAVASSLESPPPYPLTFILSPSRGLPASGGGRGECLSRCQTAFTFFSSSPGRGILRGLSNRLFTQPRSW